MSENYNIANKHKSRFQTLEFKIYFGIIVFGLGSLALGTYNISNPKSSNFINYSSRLQKGWLFNRHIDNSDAQYGSFRSNIRILIPAMLLFLFASHYTRRHSTDSRTHFSILFSLVFLFVMNGTGTIKILILITIAFHLIKYFRDSKLNPIFIWLFCILTLFSNDYFNGYKFAWINLPFLDKNTGLQSKWYQPYNFVILRIISFGFDYYWSLLPQQSEFEILRDHVRSCDECSESIMTRCERIRIQESLVDSDYNFYNFVCYVLYVPLYVAGPIISFNDFISQMKHSSTIIDYKSTFIYALRWIGAFLLMEIMQHLFYVVAISKAQAWDNFTPFQISCIGYFSLKFIWLKLLIIWRFFRLWAMSDGIITTENMQRCMSNNYSASGFWRSWHRSFNRWLIRYVYGPLGGKKYYVINFFVVFTFVAVWHDLSFNLLAWGWLISLFMLPELIGTRLIKPVF